MELYNKPVQAADSGSSEAYSDQGMGGMFWLALQPGAG